MSQARAAGLTSYQVTSPEWDTPSLCAGWRIREVVAHMTMAARYPEDKFAAELRRYDFDFGRLSNGIASRDAGFPASHLVADLRSDVMHHWAPPGGGYHGALNHVVIHGLDVTLPLGVPRWPPDATIRIVLDDLAAGCVHQHFGTRVDGRWLQATDLDWSYGSGSLLRARAGDLALMFCGQTIPAGAGRGRATVTTVPLADRTGWPEIPSSAGRIGQDWRSGGSGPYVA